jgi:hypothetical protein
MSVSPLIESLVRDAERAEAALSAPHEHAAGEPCEHPPAPRRARRATPAPEAPRKAKAAPLADPRGRLVGADAQRGYILAPRAGGHAKITLVSEKTGARYTYKIAAPPAKGGDTCAKCQGTGLWNGRAGYQCFQCKGTGEPVAKDAPPEILFVKLLTGSDNESSYSYLGNLRLTPHPRYEHGRKSTIADTAPGAKAIGWYLSRLLGDASVDGVEVWHEGVCGRCGRALTVPESIERGIGPDCWEKMGF